MFGRIGPPSFLGIHVVPSAASRVGLPDKPRQPAGQTDGPVSAKHNTCLVSRHCEVQNCAKDISKRKQNTPSDLLDSMLCDYDQRIRPNFEDTD
ncbi:Hypp5242 [Branchiostoma lanceolatum]|uniref:Hypp5242 protein n=1 Tax=Branchiostoma lanceolatum TaxID=7740 RepID=A0A8K0AEC3_BRALA|nr:Hypp5242 [Branchiostoma lanceolatum]